LFSTFLSNENKLFLAGVKGWNEEAGKQKLCAYISLLCRKLLPEITGKAGATFLQIKSTMYILNQSTILYKKKTLKPF
jgi:hypothetical protein